MLVLLATLIRINKLKDNWDSGNPYEYFMGRWSSLMAPVFIKWLNPISSLAWLDIGCGTGALSDVISQNCNPKSLIGIDPSKKFVDEAKKRLKNKADIFVGDVDSINFKENSIDMIVSGLVLNFFPNIISAFTEMKKVLKPNGIIAAYVWDYSDRMDFLRYFWDAAILIDNDARNLDEGVRFPICNQHKLYRLFQDVGLNDIEVTTLDIITQFDNIDDYWNPFLGGQGPAPSYLASLSQEKQDVLKELVIGNLPIVSDGTIKLLGRAIAIKGKL